MEKKFVVTWEKFTADGGRGCAINSFDFNTNLNITVIDVEFFVCAKVVVATSRQGFYIVD